MGRIWESINASNQHMLTHVPNGQIAFSPLCKRLLYSNFTPCPQNPNLQGRYPLQTGLHCKRCVSPLYLIPSPTSSKKDTREGQEIRRKEVCICKQEEEETRACGTGKEGEIAFEFPRACNEEVVGFPCVA